ncbi:MAG: hel [Gemmatimonadetes bacterium]|nr:hel [Gemmatimonadota bacterium]
MRKLLSLALLATALSPAACGVAQTTTLPAPAPAPAQGGMMQAPAAQAARLPNEVQWFRNSAEQRAAYLQAYRLAGDQIRRMAAGQAPGSWAVILDADETVLDNSQYQKELAQAGTQMQADTWAAWVRRQQARALPGAPAFTRMVHDLGGRVAIVTNRDEPLCDATRANLRAVMIAADLVLCRTDLSTGDKNPRFRAVEAGTAAPGIPAVHVLMWVGDNINDFPAQSQAIRSGSDEAFDRFGRSFIVLPNPMYGSWAANPPN